MVLLPCQDGAGMSSCAGAGEIQISISGVLGPSQASDRGACTPRSLFQTLFPVVTLSKPVVQLTGVAFTGFSSTQGSAVQAEPCAAPASPPSHDTVSLSQVFVLWHMELAWSEESPENLEQAW